MLDVANISNAAAAAAEVLPAGFGSCLCQQRLVMVASSHGDARDVLLSQVWIIMFDYVTA